MSFKYQAPLHFKSTSIQIAGQMYFLDTRNIIESDQDIYYILQPMGFTRYVEEPKKVTAVATTKS
ncbi:MULTISPECIES: hypothetical protein [unclassified Acinetobacter]|uniref:hypothetical protein n=1 Tax=unclassified Acinetobacter TaxID=196816 RepID=UPI0025767320|nr:MULTISPECIES: hypothetical protein [unclassified Acinetobacter]MDM1765725.1 hypothetical protein [Acinetobacter sp. 226-1]MDM1769388.1 hypothetical protein [Acinetobacter sp. 226-4]